MCARTRARACVRAFPAWLPGYRVFLCLATDETVGTGFLAWVAQQKETGGVQEGEENRPGFVRDADVGWVGETKVGPG